MKKYLPILLIFLIACSANQYTYDSKSFYFPKLECRLDGVIVANKEQELTNCAVYEIKIPIKVFIIGDVYSINGVFIKTNISDWQRLDTSAATFTRKYTVFNDDFNFKITVEVKANITLWTNEEITLYYKNTWYANQPQLIK